MLPISQAQGAPFQRRIVLGMPPPHSPAMTRSLGSPRALAAALQSSSGGTPAKFAEVAFEDGKVNHLVLSHDDFGFLCHIDCQFLDFRISFFRRIDLDKNLVELLICFIFWTFKLDFITSLSF